MMDIEYVIVHGVKRLELNITERTVMDDTFFGAPFQVSEFNFSESCMLSVFVILQDFLRNKLLSTIHVGAHKL